MRECVLGNHHFYRLDATDGENLAIRRAFWSPRHPSPLQLRTLCSIQETNLVIPSHEHQLVRHLGRYPSPQSIIPHGLPLERSEKHMGLPVPRVVHRVVWRVGREGQVAKDHAPVEVGARSRLLKPVSASNMRYHVARVDHLNLQTGAGFRATIHKQ